MTINDFNRNIVPTEDGSHTLYVPSIDEHYHSIHGAILESTHVFINNGLNVCTKSNITILEVGFGTGLNALLSLIYKGNKDIQYVGIEKYPLSENEIKMLNHGFLVDNELFRQIHLCDWNKAVMISENFNLTKLHTDFLKLDFSIFPSFDLIYFDAFAPEKQEEMWQEVNFYKIAQHTSIGGIFVTYCAKGEVRRRLERCGFKMTRIPGPPGKKEMLLGKKI